MSIEMLAAERVCERCQAPHPAIPGYEATQAICARCMSQEQPLDMGALLDRVVVEVQQRDADSSDEDEQVPYAALAGGEEEEARSLADSCSKCLWDVAKVIGSIAGVFGLGYAGLNLL